MAKAPYLPPDAFWAAKIEISDDEWPAIEATADVKFDQGARAAIVTAINRYLTESALRAASARPAEVIALLEAVAEAAEQLSAALHSLSLDAAGGPAVAALERAAVANRKDVQDPASARNRAATRKRIIDLGALARRAVATIPEDAGGRPGDPHLDKLISALHDVYRGAGGRGLYTPSSLGFLRRLCEKAVNGAKGTEIGGNAGRHFLVSEATFRDRVKTAIGKTSRKSG